MRVERLPLASLLLLGGTFGVAGLGVSEPPFALEADSVEYHYATGGSTYRGDVVVRRDSLRLTGDVIEVTRAEDAKVRIVVQGRPGTFEDVLSADVTLSIEAGKIDYDELNQTVRMYDNVTVRHGGNVFRGNYIVYDIKKSLVYAPRQRERVHLTIDPGHVTTSEKARKQQDSD